MNIDSDYILNMINKVAKGEINQSPIFYCNKADMEEAKKRLGGFEVVELEQIEVI